MNHIYRLIWNQTLGALVPVAEITRYKNGSGASQRNASRPRLAPLSGALLLALGLAAPGSVLAAASISTAQGGSTLTQSVTQAMVAPPVNPLPNGGQVVSGQATIGQSGNTLTINQGSQNTVLNWQSFSIGADQTVTFNQPNRSSVALNRVLGSDPSAIYGCLNANGQVFLVNPNGIYFARGAQVNVGGIVASTLNITDQDFLNGNYRFAGASTAGVRNDGSINAAPGGYVAFIGANVSNNGSIATPEGTTALGAGGSVNLTLAGNSLLSFQVSSSALNALAANGGLIQANGGTVILSAQAKDALLQTVVNNTGQIQAQTVQNHHGTIELLGGDSGTVQVASTLDASAPNGGDGGFIETSGTHVKVADGSTITTHAASGNNGTWLIDPQDFTIAASGGDISGATLSTQLGSGNVTIQSTTGGTAGNGDIFVNDTVNWSANTLTLNAYRDIVINTAMNGSGTAGLALQYGQGSTNGVIGGITSDYLVNAPINLASGNSFSTKLGSSGSTVNYIIITSLGVAGDASTAPGTMTLQGLAASTSLNGHYVLGANIDASATSTWNPDGSGGYYGFKPIGSNSNAFSGIFDGLNHTISGLMIHRPSANAVGLFGEALGATIRNVGLVGGSVTGNASVGGLIGISQSSSASNAYNTGDVSGSTNVGGLVGFNRHSTISHAYATGNINSAGDAGGLVGINITGIGSNSNGGSTISDAYATGNVNVNCSIAGNCVVGGLVGVNLQSTIINTYATGHLNVSGGFAVGGLVGSNTISGSIFNGYWDTTTGLGAGVGKNAATITGGGGLTTAQLAAALPSGFDSATWGNGGNRTTPYLLANTSFQTYSGSVLLGTDTSTTPTQYKVIINLTQLQNINSTGLGLNYVLGANIDASATATWNGGAGFVPIGSSVTPYTGIFDGSGHTISQLSINRPSLNNVGLFGYVNGGTVRNIGLLGSNIAGFTAVGGLVGQNDAGTIDGVYALGNIRGNTNVGGLVGANHTGTITNAYATSAVSGSTRVGGLTGTNNAGTVANAYASGSIHGDAGVGGLVGANSAGTITNAYAASSVSGSTHVGGLVGTNNTGTVTNAYASGSIHGDAGVGGLVGANSTGTITNAYATGAVSGGIGIGGLAGTNQDGTVANAYASGHVTGSTDVGGLVGSNGGSINSAYATGLVTGTYFVGGLVGANASGTITNGYWDTTTSTTLTGVGVGSAPGAKGLTTAQLAAVLPTGFSSNTWSNADNQITPYLLANTSFDTVSGSVLLGTDTSATPAQYKVIASLSQLQNINNDLSGHYVLGANIDASATSTWNPDGNGGYYGFAPIGDGSNAFSGTIDGLNLTISHLAIKRSSTNDVGLFGYVNGGTVRNIGLVDGSITGNAYVGGLIGQSSVGTITNAYVTGNVNGSTNVGGLVGANLAGTITGAYATGTVSGSSNIGGLLGTNHAGTVANAYASGKVSGNTKVGGLVGSNAGAINSAYATGRVTGNEFVGGLVGVNSSGSITNGYWDTSTSATPAGVGIGPTSGAIGLTTAQLSAKLPTGFSSRTWSNVDNQTTPYLLSNSRFSSISGHVILGSDNSTTPIYYDVILDATQLQHINDNLTGYYVLGADINASATSTWNPDGSGGYYGFKPIGSSTNAFSGIFDGLNHTISGLMIHRPSANAVGLFGEALGATIRNVGLVGGSVTGNASVGGLIGISQSSSASNAYNTGDVSGSTNVGGLVGFNRHSTISHAYATGNINSAGDAGGLVGINIAGVGSNSNGGSTISDAYATGNVNVNCSIAGNCVVGGLVGVNLQSTIINTYATGHLNVSGGFAVGGLVGSNTISGSIFNGYWDTTTGLGAGVGKNTATITGGGGLTAAQMMQQSSFTGFDFSSPAWVIYNGHTMPLLNVFLTPLTVTASNQSQTYTGGTFTLLNPTYSVAGADTSGRLFGLSNPYNGAVNVGSYTPGLWSDQQGYRITVVGGDLTITPKALSLLGLTASDKVYDGGTTAIIFDWGSLLGVVGSDAVSLATSGATADFADATVGAGKVVTVTGLGLTGGSSANYTLVGGTQTTGSIFAAALPDSVANALATASHHLSEGYAGVDGFGFALDPQAQWQLQSHGDPGSVHLTIQNGEAPCHRVINTFASQTSTGDGCLLP